MRRSVTVALGAATTLLVGVGLSFVPVAGNLVGPVVGGAFAGVRSREAPHVERMVNGFVAALVGGVVPGALLLMTLRNLWSSPSLPGASLAGGYGPLIAVAVLFGVVGAVSARFHPDPGPVHPAVRDGT